MVGIVISAHGQLARTMRETAEMIAGPQESVTEVCLLPGEAPELLVERLKAAIQQVEADAGVLLLIDLLGGSPSNAVAALAEERPHLQAVTGVNLPMLLEILITREGSDAAELARQAVSSGKEGVMDLMSMLREG